MRLLNHCQCEFMYYTVRPTLFLQLRHVCIIEGKFSLLFPVCMWCGLEGGKSAGQIEVRREE